MLELWSTFHVLTLSNSYLYLSFVAINLLCTSQGLSWSPFSLILEYWCRTMLMVTHSVHQALSFEYWCMYLGKKVWSKYAWFPFYAKISGIKYGRKTKLHEIIAEWKTFCGRNILFSYEIVFFIKISKLVKILVWLK